MNRNMMMFAAVLLLLGSCLLGCDSGDLPVTYVEPEPEVTVDIYDELADGDAQIAAALAEAEAGGKRVLITWGGDWCLHCRNLHTVFTTDEAIKTIVEENYVDIKVDVGERERHMDLALEYGADLEDLSIPHMMILDETGTVVGEIRPEDYVDDDADFLEQFHPEFIAERLASLAEVN